MSRRRGEKRGSFCWRGRVPQCAAAARGTAAGGAAPCLAVPPPLPSPAPVECMMGVLVRRILLETVFVFVCHAFLSRVTRRCTSSASLRRCPCVQRPLRWQRASATCFRGSFSYLLLATLYSVSYIKCNAVKATQVVRKERRCIAPRCFVAEWSNASLWRKDAEF